MILLKHYIVQNGSKSEPFILNLELETKKQLEEMRAELEIKHQCYKTMFGNKEKIADIFFHYIEK